MMCTSPDSGSPLNETPGASLLKEESPAFPGPAGLMDYIHALQEEKLRLQALVCHLLCENQQLRIRHFAPE